MTGVTGHGGRSSHSGRAASAGSGNSVGGGIRTRTADSKKHVDAKSRSQKPASPRDPKPIQKSAQKLSASSKGEPHRELSAIRERPDTAATEGELDGEKITTQGDGDGAESTPRDSGNHSLAGEDPTDLRESDNRETDFEHPEYKEADRTESENRESQRGETDHSTPEQHREPEHIETEEQDPEHGEPKYQELEHEKLEEKKFEHVESGQQELKQRELEHQESKQQNPEYKVTSKQGSRVSTRQEQRSSSKPPSRASSKQSRRASSKEDQRASSKQSQRTSSKKDHRGTPKTEERESSKQRTTLNEDQKATSKQEKTLTEAQRPPSNQRLPLKEEEKSPLKQGTQLKEERRTPSKQEHDADSAQDDVHLELEYLTSHPEPPADLAGVVDDPGTQNVQDTELEPMSGDMEVLRAAENMSLAGGPETGVSHSMALEHVIIEKYHEEPQVEDKANPYSGPVEVPPLLTDLEEEPDEPVHIAEKRTKTEPEVVPESKHEQKLDENRNREHASRRGERGHPKQKETGPGKEPRVSSKTAPHGPAGSEIRKQTTNTRQSRKTTKISRSKPVARSHEDLRDLHEGGNSKMATLRLPDDTAALQKSASLVNIPRNPSALMADLHVYLVPREKWSAPRRLAERTSKQDTISLGFVRVHPDSNLNLLRRDISAQLLGNELALRHYKFVRPVGKHFTQVKAKQESHLKARNFMPPYTSDPEIHLLRLLPHDPLDELEDAAYWRRWDRAFRLDRDYPLVRNTFLNLRKKLATVKQRRAENEQKRDELVILSRSLQEQLSRKKDEDMQKWRDLYLQERKLTGPLEEACSSLRREIDKLHKKLLLRVETRHKGTGKEGPSRKLTMKINCKRLASDIEDWERRVLSMKKIQETEVKLRKQAERDVKELRQELSQKRVTVTQARSQYGLDAVDWYLLLGRQKAAGRVSRSPSRQAAVAATAATPQPA